MFIFNTTFVVTSPKFSSWEQWLKNTYTPLIKSIVPASKIQAFEVMTVEKTDERTISVQCKIVTPSDLETVNQHSSKVFSQMRSEFGQDALFFSSILREL